MQACRRDTSNLLLMLNYNDGVGAAELMHAHRDLGARIGY